MLTKNSQGCQLHGGKNNLSRYNWQIDSVAAGFMTAKVRFSAFLPDGLDGYPGNRCFYCTYTLEDTSRLTIEYFATTDQPTYINMSNHTYWNLSGDFTVSALTQTLQIFSNEV